MINFNEKFRHTVQTTVQVSTVKTFFLKIKTVAKLLQHPCPPLSINQLTMTPNALPYTYRVHN